MSDHRTRWLGVLVVALLGLAPASASAEPEHKRFTVNFKAAELAPNSSATLETRVLNTSTKHLLGAANLVAPTGFTILDGATASRGRVIKNGRVLELRDLSMTSGQFVDVTVPVKVDPAACGDFEWFSAAKQSNDFNGTGNDLVLDRGASQLVTDTTKACDLVFVQQPARARVGESIRGVDFEPASPKIVSVKLLDATGGTSLAGKASSVKIKAEPFFRGTGQLVGTTTEQVENGVAYFDDIRMTEPGGYRLVAHTEGGVIAQSGSDPFTVETNSVFCEANVDCSVTISRSDIVGVDDPVLDQLPEPPALQMSSSTSMGGLAYSDSVTTGTVTLSATAIGDSTTGYLTASLFNYPIHDCADYSEPAASDGKIDGVARRKLVKLTYSATLVGSRPASAFELCFAAPYAFLAEGIPSTADLNGDGTPDAVSARIPDCNALAQLAFAHPCVLRRTLNGDGSVTVEVDVPRNPQDPMYR